MPVLFRMVDNALSDCFIGKAMVLTNPQKRRSLIHTTSIFEVCFERSFRYLKGWRRRLLYYTYNEILALSQTDLASRSCCMARSSRRELVARQSRYAPSPHRPASQCSQQGQPRGEAWGWAGLHGFSMNHQNRPVCFAIPAVPRI